MGRFPRREHAGRTVSAESTLNITITVTKFLSQAPPEHGNLGAP